MTSASRLALLVVSFFGVACDDPKPPARPAASATAIPATTQAASAKPKTMPELTVDSDGPYLGGRRVDMKAPDAKEKLSRIVKDLPVSDEPVTLLADKKAKTPHVAAVVAELGAAGAPKVIIKTDGRDDLPKEIVVVPPSKAGAPAACSVAAMVMKDLSTAVWPSKGGTGKRQRKGLAGPDLSHTGETLQKELLVCDSKVAFVSGDDEIDWEMTHNLAGTIVSSDKKKKIESLVLLREAPVAGRAIALD